MTTSTDRQQFRSLVAEVAERAKAILPQAVNGRVESAVKLVLLDEVQPQTDGTVHVGSCTDPTKVYTLSGHACNCQDFTQGKAPDSWCEHRIAAGIQKRVHEVLANLPPPAPAPPAAPLPEAAASVNVRVQIGGREVQWTLRDSDEGRLGARLDALLARYPVDPSPTAHAPEKGWCATHGVQMMQTTKEGRSWWSHKTAQGWCKGKGGTT